MDAKEFVARRWRQAVSGQRGFQFSPSFERYSGVPVQHPPAPNAWRPMKAVMKPLPSVSDWLMHDVGSG